MIVLYYTVVLHVTYQRLDSIVRWMPLGCTGIEYWVDIVFLAVVVNKAVKQSNGSENVKRTTNSNHDNSPHLSGIAHGIMII